jgi:hypothetical protein
MIHSAGDTPTAARSSMVDKPRRQGADGRLIDGRHQVVLPAYEFVGASFIIGCLYCFLVQTRKPPEVLAEHLAEVPTLAGERMPLGEMAP